MSESRIRNAADPKQVKRAEQQDRLTREQRLSDLRAVLDMPHGRRLLYGWITELQPRTQMWAPNAGINFNAVKHDIGGWILDQIEDADPNAWIRMQVEAVARKPVETGPQKATTASDED